ncbi:MAG TPA: VOC family protein [Acidimicrobiia bacterium]|nr:VOC family protein [Acidimicrobiia bacterium]
MSTGAFEAATASVILRCRDLGTTVPWYRECLGWAPVSSGSEGGDHHVTFSVGGLLISLWELPVGVEPAQAGIRGAYVAMYVHENLERLRDRLTERGVAARAIIDAGDFRSFRFSDPDGNVFEVTSSVASTPAPTS